MTHPQNGLAVPGATPTTRLPAERSLFSRDFVLLFAGQFFFMLCISVYFLLPYYLELRGTSQAFYGTAAGIPAFAAVASLLALGHKGDHWPRKVSVLAYMAVGLAGSLLALLAAGSHPGWFMLARALHGVTMGMGFPLVFTWVVEISPHSRRTEALAYMGVAGLLSNSLGPALGEALLALQPGPITPGHYQLVFLVTVVLSVLGLVFFGLVGDKGLVNGGLVNGGPVNEGIASGGQDETGGNPPSHLGALLNTPARRRILWITLAFGGVFGLMTSFGKNYVAAQGLAMVSVLFAAHSVGALASRVAIRPIMRHLTPSRLVMVGLGGVAVSQVILALTDSYALLIACGLVYGLSHGVLYPTLNVRFFDQFTAAELGRASILYSGAFTAGVGLFPYLGGFLLGWVSFPALFILASGAALWALWYHAGGEKGGEPG